MKLFVLPVAVLLCSVCRGQSRIIDSLHLALRTEKSDTSKAILLYNLSYYYQKFKPDSALQLAQEALQVSQKSKFTRGISNSLAQMAGAFNRLGNYPKALEYYIEQLKIEEKQESLVGIAYVHMDIAHVYNSEKDTEKALYYALRADSIARKHNLKDVLVYTSLNIGDIYSDANQLDSAKKYTSLCYEESVKQKNDIITGTALNNLGNIYFRSGDMPSALQNFQQSTPFLKQMQDMNTLAECRLGIAKVYQKLGLQDSALYYAKQSFALASESDFLKHALNSSALLSQLYKHKGVLDSAFAFQETQLILKDSFDNRERIKEVQNITISEQVRQKELAETRAREKKQRRTMLQLLAIGIFIPVCFFITAFASRKNVNEKVISFLGVFSVLLLFEYITLFVHPWVVTTTNHSPVFEIIIFVTIAAVLTPTHHKIEKWLVSKLTLIHISHRQLRLKALQKKQEKLDTQSEGSDPITVEAPVDPL
jgi:tetratricopeptide (TPR) repeat protein